MRVPLRLRRGRSGVAQECWSRHPRASGQVLGSEFTQDTRHTSGVLTVTADQAMRGASIVFSKAKTFGAHNDMYSASVPSDQKGRRVTICWLKD